VTNTEKLPCYSIVIPYYNNEQIIRTCLPSVITLSKRFGRITEIIGIDDCSTDRTAELLKNEYPEVTLLRNESNLGFGKTCNRGILAAANEWVILLNSDISLSSDIIPLLDKEISVTQDLFQIAFYSFNENGARFEGQKFIIGKTGLFKTRNNFSEYDENKVYDTLYACGGHCLISRSKFLELKGFSSVFEPFYWEDTDLSYRGLKRGWKVLFAPQCKVTHCHRGSIRSANSQRKISIIQTRNKILFFWKNVSSINLWLYHLSGIIFRFFTSWIAGDFVFYSALFRALKQIPVVVQERHWNKKHEIVSDNIVLNSGK